MIYRNSTQAREIVWWSEPNDEAGAIARRFLEGEHELLQLARARTSTIVDMTTFLENAGSASLTVRRAATGELLVSAYDGEDLLLTGRTASVLRGYIDNEPVRMHERLDMTQRIHAGMV